MGSTDIEEEVENKGQGGFFLNIEVGLDRQGLGMDAMVLREVEIFRQEPHMLGARRVSLCMVQQQR